MSTPLARLRLQQIFDSQFPVGSFAHSGGIETYASLGVGLIELREILGAQVALGWGRSELAAAHLAWLATGRLETRAGDDRLSSSASGGEQKNNPLSRLAREIDAMKVVPAVRSSSIGLGRRTLELLRRLYPDVAVDVDPTHHAVVIGAAGRRLGIDVRDLLLAYAQSLAMGTLAAAMRCMPVSPPQVQALLVESHAAMVTAVERALADPGGSLFTCMPALDIRSHEQAFLRTRLFQT